MFAFYEVDLVVLDCRNLGEYLVGKQALSELFGAKCERLGDNDDIGVHGNNAFQAGSLVPFNARFFSRVDSACSHYDTALS